MNKIFNHLKLLYVDVKEIAPDVYALLDSNLEISLYIYGSIVNDVDTVVTCQHNITVVKHGPSSISIFRNSKLVDSCNDSNLRHNPSYYALVCLISNYTDISDCDNILTKNNLSYSGTELKIFTSNCRATNYLIRGSTVTNIVVESEHTTRGFLVCNGRAYEKESVIADDSDSLVGYQLELNDNNFYLVDIVAGTKVCIDVSKVLNVDVPNKAMLCFSFMEFPNKYVYKSNIPLSYYNQGLDVLIEIPKDNSEIKIYAGNILPDNKTFIKCDNGVLYSCDCNDNVSLSGKVIPLIKYNTSLAMYLNSFILTDNFIYDTMRRIIYKAIITDIVYYDITDQYGNVDKMIVLSSENYKFYASKHGVLRMFTIGTKTRATALMYSCNYIIVDRDGFLLSKHIFDTQEGANRALQHLLKVDAQPVKSHKLTMPQSEVAPTKSAVSLKTLQL